MTDPTPKKRADLRKWAERARPFVRPGGIEPAGIYIYAVDLLALLDERDRLADALARAQGPFHCCPHCEDDLIHDVGTNGHEVPCTLCQASVGEIERLLSERDSLAAQVERVRELHDDRYGGACIACGGWTPCATRRALDADA